MNIRLSKIFYILLIFYMSWFQIAFFQIPNLLLALGGPMVGFLVLHMIQHKTNLRKVFPVEINLWIIFGLIVLFFSFFNAPDKALHVSSVFTYFQFLMITWAIIYISYIENKVSFFMNAFIVLALFSAITTLVMAYDYGGGRITMGPANNPNGLGLMMTFAIGYILFKLDLKKILSSGLLLSLVMLFSYIAIMTGSRKSILAIAVLVFLWIIMVSIPQISRLTLKEKTKYILILGIFVFLTLQFIVPVLTDSVLWVRMTRLIEQGDEIRSGMYLEAWRIFQDYPVFGAGMQQYRVLSIYRSYSHSTYAEAIANTGIIGTLTYFSVYLIVGYKYLIKSIKNHNNSYRIILAMFVMVLFLGTSIIHFYGINSFIFFGIMIAYIKIKEREKKHVKVEDVNAPNQSSH